MTNKEKGNILIADKERLLKDKTKFYALYYKQDVLIRVDEFGNFTKMANVDAWWLIKCFNDELNGEILRLKPLSEISDEEAIEVAKIISGPKNRTKAIYSFVGEFEYNDKDKRVFIDLDFSSIKSANPKIERYATVNITKLKIEGVLGVKSDTISECIDYLRSRGYALPWMNYSIEDQINNGWIKLV